MLGNGRCLKLLSNSDTVLEKYFGALQWLEVMLLDPEYPTQKPGGGGCTAMAMAHC